MKDAIRSYVDEVMREVSAQQQTKARLAQDLTAHLREAAQRVGQREAIDGMGSAQEVAREIMDGLYAEREDLMRELSRARREYGYQYRSRTHLFGWPLVHINLSTRPLSVARGVIAIGNIAVGALAIGGIALGLVSIGGACVGLLLALGGMALGAGLSFGGVALGTIAFGGLAIGVISVGGAAIAHQVGVGGYAAGKVAVGDVAKGAAPIDADTATYQQIYQAIRTHCPKIWDWLAHLLSQIGSSLR